jgi:predicted Fe-Mo cluster-binding NifX family protein
MKVAVSSTGTALDAAVHSLFGRCDFLLIIDTDTETMKPIKNDFTGAVTGAGTGCAQAIIKEGVQSVISGQFGPNAYEVLKAAGLEMYSTPQGLSVREALDRLKAGTLPKMEIKRF